MLIFVGVKSFFRLNMKPLLIKETTEVNESFMLQRKEFQFFPVNFHYHDEMELVLKVSSSGEMIAGNYMGRFESGDLFLLGNGLPHYWKNDEKFYTGDAQSSAISIVAHFNKNFAGNHFFETPEMHNINSMFVRADRGIHFGQDITQKATDLLNDLLLLSGFERFMGFVNLLQLLAVSEDYKLLSTNGFSEQEAVFKQSEPLRKIYEYVMTNFKNEISQTHAAEIVGMNISAFSRFFRKSTKKTFTQFVNEVRLGFASRLLMEGELNITQIAYECGYRNISNFNNQFKSLFNQTPSEYRNSFYLGKKV